MGRGYWVNRRFFSTATGCVNSVQPKHTYPAAAHRVHGLDHARSRGHAARVFLQAVGLLVYCLHLDVGLTQGDPASTWKPNKARLKSADRSVFSSCRGKFRGDLDPYGGEEAVGVWFALVRCELFGFGLSILSIILWKTMKSSTEHADWVFVVCKHTESMTHCLCAAGRR